MSSKLENFKNRVHSTANSNQVGFDPGSAMLIAEIILELVKMWRDCYNRRQDSEEVAVCSIKEPGRREIAAVKRSVRRNIGWVRWMRGDGNTLVESILTEMRNSSLEDIKEVYREA